jgi:hypothetical protein
MTALGEPLKIGNFNQKTLHTLMVEHQDVYDRVLRAEAGNSVESVKASLAREFRIAFGRELTEPALTHIAVALAGSMRVEVTTRRPQGKRPQAR